MKYNTKKDKFNVSLNLWGEMKKISEYRHHMYKEMQ